jgi:hypothetical protein
MTKGAVATGISLGRETYGDVIKYHQKVEKFFLRTEGRRPSLSETMEVLIKTGLEAVKEFDFDKVMQAMRKREAPNGVQEQARKRKAGILGAMTDADVEDLLKGEK